MFTFLLGILALLQITVIPGYLLMGYLTTWKPPCHEGEKPPAFSPIQKWVYGFGLSLLFNYLLVFLLTLLGIYTSIICGLVVIVEAGLLVYDRKFLVKAGQNHHGPGIFALNTPQWAERIRAFFHSHSLVFNFLFLAACLVLLVYVFYFFYFLGTVFEHWDPVTGWNRFAVAWAHNRLPGNSWHYPQLIPANWSLTYVFMGNTAIQFFARALMPLFAIGVLLLFLDLALRYKRSAYLLALIFYGMILGYLYDPSYIVSGYMDIPVSFFAFLAFHVMHSRYSFPGSTALDASGIEAPAKGSYFNPWVLAVLFASAAAVTKQAGLFILFVIFPWAGIDLIKKRKTLSYKQLSKMLRILVLIIGVVVASWYLLKEVQIREGKDRSEVQMVQAAHHTDTLQARVEFGFEQILHRRHPKLTPLVLAGMALMILGLFHPLSRWVTLFIFLPYGVLWLMLFSYDTRNLALALPFAAFSAAFGSDWLKQCLPALRKIPPIKINGIYVAIFLVVVLGIMNFTIFKGSVLGDRQERLQKKIGDSELNARLYQYQQEKGFTGKIATNYQYLGHLPGLDKYYYYLPGRLTLNFLDYLETPQAAGIHYLLIPSILEREKEISQRVREKMSAGEFRFIFKWRGYHFLQVRIANRR